jgi:sarcosine oxidase
MPEFDVAVIGLGAMGSAAAYHLSKRGRSVLGVDRFTPPHASGSSHGRTRIIREAYFEHPLYVPLVQRAYELWSELESFSGRELLRITGGLMIGRPESVLVRGARTSAEQYRLRHELLTSEHVQKRFPALRPDPDMVAVWEPRAGILCPEDCISVHLALARTHGATLRYDEPVTSWRSDGGGVRIVTRQGEYRAARMVLTAGAWVASLVPELNLPLSVERQVLYWFAPRAGSASFDPASCPVHLWEFEPQQYFYGFPDMGDGVKVGRHHAGETADPEQLRREVSLSEVAAIRELVQRFLPDADGALRSSDEHFWIDSHQRHPEILIASPCSGHGFKFSSVIGEILADLVAGEPSRFDLGLFRRR